MDRNAQRKIQDQDPDKKWMDTVDPLALRDAMILAVEDMKKAQAVVEAHAPGSILLIEMECDCFMATLEHVSRCRNILEPPDCYRGEQYDFIRDMVKRSTGRSEHLGVSFDHFTLPIRTLGKFIKVAEQNGVRVFTCRLKSSDAVNVILELKLDKGRVLAVAAKGSRTN